MSDKLKQFIDDNRKAFDSENPDPKLYSNLQQKYKTANPGKVYPMKLFRRVAAVAAVMILSVSLYFILKKNNSTTIQGPENAVDVTAFPDPAYAKQIDQYQQMIDLQQMELKKVENEHPDLYRQFTDDINQLDSSYRALKTTLEKNPNTEMLLEAMIRNLQLQSELLNRQLLIIKEIKQKSKT
jgi:hypothetical protein